MLDVSILSFGRLLLACDRPLAAMVHGRSAASCPVTSIATIGETRNQGEKIVCFQTSNTSLEAVEGAPRMATSIRRKTEEQLKLHPCRLQISEYSGAPGAWAGHRWSIPCHIAGAVLGSRPTRRACPHATQLKHFFRHWLYTRRSLVAAHGGRPRERAAGTRQCAFRSGTIVISAMHHHRFFSRT
jgi:hypothetical protein